MNNNTKILILDNSPDILLALSMFLKEELFNVCAVSTEKLFIAALKEFAPDVIMIDVYFNSTINGREICRLIKADVKTKNVPVMLMSTSAKLLIDFEECNASAVIEKPFDLSELLQKIRTLVNGEIRKNYLLNEQVKKNARVFDLKNYAGDKANHTGYTGV